MKRTAKTKRSTQRSRISKPIKLTLKRTIKLGSLFLQAFVFAAEKHKGQTRKASTIPYIAHLMGVASLVLEAGGDENLAIAALLHDVVEDCGGASMLKEVRRRFGARVAKVVDGCTDADTDPKPPWLARKKAYLRHLRSANPSVLLVSAADKLYNASEILADLRQHKDEVWTRFKGGKKGTLWYYREVAKILQRKGPKDLVVELNRVVSQLLAASRTAI